MTHKKLAGGLFTSFLLLAYGCGQNSSSFSGANAPSQGSQVSTGDGGVLARAASPSPTGTASPYYPPTTPTLVAAGANGLFRCPSLSNDGSKLAFTTNSSNLVSGAGARPGNPGFLDALVKDQTTLQYQLASRPSGTSLFANNITERACVSNAGDKVMFVSYANNLAYDGLTDPSGNPSFAPPLNAYFRSLSSNQTQAVSLTAPPSYALGGVQAISPGANRYALFESYSNLYRKDTQTNLLSLVAQVTPPGQSLPGFTYQNAISLDGTRVMLNTSIFSLSAGGTIATTPGQAMSLSGDGNWWVTAQWSGSGATYTLRNVNTGASQTMSTALGAYYGLEADTSDDGRYTVLSLNDVAGVAADTNTKLDIYVYDRITQTKRLVSSGQAAFHSGVPAISGNGSTVVWLEDVTGNGPPSEGRLFVRKNPFF